MKLCRSNCISAHSAPGLPSTKWWSFILHTYLVGSMMCHLIGGVTRVGVFADAKAIKAQHEGNLLRHHQQHEYETMPEQVLESQPQEEEQEKVEEQEQLVISGLSLGKGFDLTSAKDTSPTVSPPNSAAHHRHARATAERHTLGEEEGPEEENEESQSDNGSGGARSAESSSDSSKEESDYVSRQHGSKELEQQRLLGSAYKALLLKQQQQQQQKSQLLYPYESHFAKWLYSPEFEQMSRKGLLSRPGRADSNFIRFGRNNGNLYSKLLPYYYHVLGEKSSDGEDDKVGGGRESRSTSFTSGISTANKKNNFIRLGRENPRQNNFIRLGKKSSGQEVDLPSTASSSWSYGEHPLSSVGFFPPRSMSTLHHRSVSSQSGNSGGSSNGVPSSYYWGSSIGAGPRVLERSPLNDSYYYYSYYN